MPAMPASAAPSSTSLARPAQGLTISLGGAYNDAEITEDFCLIANADFDCTLARPDGDATMPARARRHAAADHRAVQGQCPRPLRIPGRRRCDGHVQVSAVHEGSRTRDLRLVQRAIYGDLDALHDRRSQRRHRERPLVGRAFARNLFDERGALGSGIQCNERSAATPTASTAIGAENLHLRHPAADDRR